MENRIEIIKKEYHRNGINGQGFWVVIFNTGEHKNMCAFIFKPEGQIAITNIDELQKHNIGINNKWRGDNFEAELRAEIDFD